MVGDEECDAEVGEALYFVLEVFDGEWVDAGEGFVEEDECWVGGECAGDFEFSSFAAGACSCGFRFFVCESEAIEEFCCALFSLFSVEAEGFEDGEEVFFAGESCEDGWFLGEVAHAEAGAFVHGEV